MFPLYSLLQTGFTHRKLGDGTEDSICLLCFATVVRGPNDTHLAAAEAVHDCWQKKEAALKRNAALAKQA
jgi:hypothetical protein